MALDLETATNDSVNIPDVPVLEIAGQITICCWAKIESTDGLRYIIAKGLVGGGGENWLRLNGTQLQGGTFLGSDTKAVHVLTGTELTDWTFFAIVYDGAVWRLYINGVEEGTFVSAQGARTVAGIGWAIGAKRDDNTRHFDGAIADARLYDRGLTSNEIGIIFTYRGTDGIRNGLQGQWRADELDGVPVTSLVDFSGNGNDGTPVASPVYVSGELTSRRRSC